jgi:hypothetical protein
VTVHVDKCPAGLGRRLRGGRHALPLFYGNRTGLIDIMRHAIALNGSFFTAQRMLQEYTIKAYSQ